MGSYYGPAITATQLPQIVNLSANLAQAAATYTLGTVSGGDILITGANFYVSTAGVGLVSVAVASNDTIPTTLLSALNGAVAGLLLGANLTQFATPFYLPAGKLLQFAIVGTGSAGVMKCAIQYRPLSQGALLS